MQVSERGLALIKHFEGFRAAPYQCQAGVWTIGYGHTKGVKKETLLVTESEANTLLAADLSATERSIARLVYKPLTQPQFDALCSFTFNLGGGALQRSSLRMALNRGDYESAANQFLRWTWAGGVKRAGLLHRRKAERALFLSN